MKRILVVDDNSTVQRVLSHTLRNNGYDVVTVGDAFAALAELETKTFDLAIIDLAMPGMDGITLLKQLRRDPRHQFLPVMMLTASGMDQDRIDARNEGANAFLTKPASSHELLETVSRLLKQEGNAA